MIALNSPLMARRSGIAALVLFTLTILAGCGGDNNNPPVKDNDPPVKEPVAPITLDALTLTGSTPVDGAVAVTRTVAPQLTFSTGLDGATATGANVTLSSIAGSVPASLTVAGNQLTVTPSLPLALFTTYSLQAGTGLTGTGGEKLASPRTVNFKTADGAWNPAQLVETGGNDASAPHLAFDASGNAMAVWVDSDGSNFDIRANRYVAGVGWGTPQVIDAGSDYADGPKVAFDTDGNAIAIWQQYVGSTGQIVANRFVKGAGWGVAQQIDGGSGHSYTPQIGFDAAGNAIAVWRQSHGSALNIRSNRYVAGVGWGAAQLIEAGVDYADAPQIAVHADGSAIAVWNQFDTTMSIYANRYVPGVGWGAEQLLETSGLEGYSPQIAVARDGNALAVWFQHDGAVYNIYASHYGPGTGWEAPQLIDSGNEEAAHPQIAMDASGNAIAVWRQTDGVTNNIHANRYVAGTGWGAAQAIEATTDNAEDPQIAMDASGNGVASWRQSGGGAQSIYANRYTAGSGWGAAQSLEADNGQALEAKVAIDGRGNAVVVWNQFDGSTQNIHAARFD